MRTFVTINLHENYAQVVVRFMKNSRHYNEFSRAGVSVFELLKHEIKAEDLFTLLRDNNSEDYDVQWPYLNGFVGHFTITYEVDENNITLFEATEARSIVPQYGGKNVLGGFTNKSFKQRILMNLLNNVTNKNIEKLNEQIASLRRIGN